MNKKSEKEETYEIKKETTLKKKRNVIWETIFRKIWAILNRCQHLKYKHGEIVKKFTILLLWLLVGISSAGRVSLIEEFTASW